jgi:hypothetical protein
LKKEKAIVEMCELIDPVSLPNGSVYRGEWNDNNQREGVGI